MALPVRAVALNDPVATGPAAAGLAALLVIEALFLAWFLLRVAPEPAWLRMARMACRRISF